MEQHENYMRHAIELAKRGFGFTNPNPLVGAVIVKDGRIIGEGWHAKYGDLHAERNALKNCTESPKGATIYVTLEPCCHHGKQPPCTEALVEAGIQRVYIGSRDPNPLVSGKGVQFLRERGIEVITDFLREECDALNKIFFHYIPHKMPYVILKYAMTMDGKIACKNGASQWITGESARGNVHVTRKRVAAILVGIGTVLADDPMLNCRVENPSHPTRVVMDTHLQIPLNSKLVQTAREIPLIIYTASQEQEKISALEEQGVTVVSVESQQNHVSVSAVLKDMGQRGLDSVLVEGGASIHGAFLQAKLVDLVQVYIGGKIIGGDGLSPIAPMGILSPQDAMEFSAPNITTFGNDILLEYERSASCLQES